MVVIQPPTPTRRKIKNTIICIQGLMVFQRDNISNSSFHFNYLLECIHFSFKNYPFLNVLFIQRIYGYYFFFVAFVFHIFFTVCLGSSDPFYVVSYYVKWVTTSWTHSMFKNFSLRVNVIFSYEHSYSFIVLFLYILSFDI